MRAFFRSRVLPCLLILLFQFSSQAAQAFETGDVAYLCRKNDKLLWVVGPDKYTACAVRVLRNAGGSVRILAHSRGCSLPGFGAGFLNRGQEAWVESYQLWSTRSSCESRGQKKKAVSKPKTYPLKVENHCKYDYTGFIHYKNLAGNWVNSEWIWIPKGGKRYNARNVQTKNTVFYYYFKYREGPYKDQSVFTKKPAIRLEKDGKSYGLHKFQSSGLPPASLFASSKSSVRAHRYPCPLISHGNGSLESGARALMAFQRWYSSSMRRRSSSSDRLSHVSSNSHWFTGTTAAT